MAAIGASTGSGPQQKLALDNGLKNIEDLAFVGVNGKPLTRITVAAAELIPTIQYGNCLVGPVAVMRYVEENSDEELKKEIRAAQTLCEEAVAEDRQSVHALTRQSSEGRV